MKKGNMKFGRYEFNADSVYRALQHHESEGRITHLELITTAAGKVTFLIRLAAGYDMDTLEYNLRDAYMLNIGMVTMERLQRVREETVEVERTMTIEQEQKLRDLCERYGVEFRMEDYTPQFDLPTGWVAGWVGGLVHAAVADYGTGTTPNKQTIYVGVSPEGEASS